MVFKCKICGGQLDFNQGDLITTCPYCGVKQALPKIDNDEKLSQLYSIANHYLMNNEFDKAERLFLEIVSLSPNDPEGYWQLVMCKYGITYVTDYKNGEKVPTVNRTYYSSIKDDANYQKAISLASAEQKSIYEKTAEYINNVQSDIVNISRKEKPYDIFICYKETDDAGERTDESIKAQELYYDLVNQGYKVFFSRITLEDKIGAEYEPYIFAALTSSKFMLCIGSSKENFESVWVKNEWSRYLRLIHNGEDKTIIPIVINGAELPDEFANLAPQNMEANGFAQELLRGIKKIIPTPVEALERKKRRNKILKRAGVVAGAAIIIAIILSVPLFKKNSAYNKAAELYNSKRYAESAWAFRELGDYRDSTKKAEKAELSWRKSLANIAFDESAYSQANGFGGGLGYGAYIDSNGNIEEYFRYSKYYNDEVDAQHGQICDIIGLYDDGALAVETTELSREKHVIDSNVIKAYKTCEGYVYLKSDGTIGAKKSEDDIVTNGISSYGEKNNNTYTDWGKATHDWRNVTNLVYYNDFNFSPHNASEVLIGIKDNGAVLIDGNIVDFNLQNIDFSDINNAVDADISIRYIYDNLYLDAEHTPISVSIAILKNDGTIQLLNADINTNKVVERTVELNQKIVDCVFSMADYSIKLLCPDGYVYSYSMEDDTTTKLNIGSGNVYIEPYLAITKNGSPRYFGTIFSEKCLPDSFTTRIYDEFLERIY